MNIKFKAKYFTHRTLLTFFGPATLDDRVDPLNILEKKRDEVLGARPSKATNTHIPKRHFNGVQHAA